MAVRVGRQAQTWAVRGCAEARQRAHG